MAITDLTNTKWIFNDVLDTEGQNVSYFLNFQSNNENFTFLRLYEDSNYPNEMWYHSSSNIYVYENGWSLPLYKTIFITGGTDATNSDFITWLQKNAVQDTGVLGVWKFNWTLDMTTYDWNTWNINFTAPYAGDAFKTLALTSIRTSGDYNPAGTDRLYYISDVYSNTEMTYKWMNSGARVIFISGGDDVYSDTLRDFLESNATQLFLDNISDLTNTTWEFYNDLAIPSYSSQTTYNLDFTCNFNGTEITCNKIIVPSNGAQIDYYCTSPQEQEGTISGVFTVASGWQEEGFRTIKITGGSNAATAAAIQFIQINAKQVLTYTTTNIELGSIADAIREKGSTTEQLVYPAGFISAIQNIQGGDIYEPIYKSLAYRSVIASSALGVSEWCNSLSNITSQQFAGQPFSGDFVFNNVSSIGSSAFGSVYINTTGPTSYWNCSFPGCTTIGNGIFYYNRGIKEVYFPQCSYVGSYEFCGCGNLTSISFPICTIIQSYAFSGCGGLKVINFPSCTTINDRAFYVCTSLSNINFPNCTSIGNQAFYLCSALTVVSFPNCTSIGNYAFYSCTALTTISFPNCTSIGNSGFYNCKNLSTISFPNCTFIGAHVFWSCSALTVVSFPNCTSIENYAFRYCTNLSSFYFMGSSIPYIGTYTFNDTTLTFSSYLGYYGSIYVPASLLASYKTATYWSQYSARMVGV